MSRLHANPVRLALAAALALASLAFAGPPTAGAAIVNLNASLDSVLAHHYARHSDGAASPRGAAPNPNLLFDGQKIEDFGLIQAAPGAISEVPDPTGSGRQVLQFTVHDDDVYPVTPTENPRAQALSPGLINPGDEFWLETKFLLPTDLPEIPSWFGLCSVYGAPFDGPSPWSLEINENEFRWQRNGTYDWDIPWRAPLIKGRWVTILATSASARKAGSKCGSTASRSTSSNPATTTPTTTPRRRGWKCRRWTPRNYAAPNAAKITQYRKVGMFETATDYFDQLKLGTTRASVEG